MNVGYQYAMNIGFNTYIDDKSREEIATLQAQNIAQAAQISSLEAGAVGPIVAGNAVPPANLLSVLVPSGIVTVVPLVGLGVISQPPDVWQNVDGIIVGSNDIESRITWYLTARVEDSGGGARVWQFGLVRGRDLATATPVFVERSPRMPARINVATEPAPISIVHTFTNPPSGQDFEYAITAEHDGNSARTLNVKALSYGGISIGPGT